MRARVCVCVCVSLYISVGAVCVCVRVWVSGHLGCEVWDWLTDSQAPRVCPVTLLFAEPRTGRVGALGAGGWGGPLTWER